jgi:hypothetical protein
MCARVRSLGQELTQPRGPETPSSVERMDGSSLFRDHNWRANADASVEVDDVLIVHADATV